MASALFSFFRSLFAPRPACMQSAQAQSLGIALGAAAFGRAPRPLRVVDKGQGRLVISGRMADVCAELERLAAQEARAPAR
jgi:hypothetical protein